mgnify:CR=1 FL=1
MIEGIRKATNDSEERIVSLQIKSRGTSKDKRGEYLVGFDRSILPLFFSYYPISGS